MMAVTVGRPDPALCARSDALIVKISGEIGLSAVVGDPDKHTGLDGDTALNHLLNEAVPVPPALVVIDLSDATYLSSIAIGELLRFNRRLHAVNSTLRVTGAANVLTLLRIGRLDQVLTVCPDVATALK